MIELVIGAVGAIGTIVGALVWLVRLEGRINVLANSLENTEKRIDGVEEQILNRLARIENRLDTLVARS